MNRYYNITSNATEIAKLNTKISKNANLHTFLAYQEILHATPDCGKAAFQTEAATSSVILHQVVQPITRNYHRANLHSSTKTVPEVTYNVSSETLSHYSLTRSKNMPQIL